ncbi:DUF6436 domain-containing protein [Pseudomonas sp.]|uniref:DUF6436 domain-containing protein n=1 Tax=Pseudomonas sp. TaxID=306 RepID=UPI00257E7D40|nr:DUF6436 domain-containing protein [Pseudomonas sp.]
MPRFSRKTLLACAIAGVSVIVLILAFSWFEARYVRSFSERTAIFSGEQLQLPAELAGPGAIRMVHFWDPACPCNVGNQQHLAELVKNFTPLGVEFYAVQKPGSHGELPADLKAIKALPALPGSADLPASPAVAIWDREGKLAYFGPYSSGITCNSSNSFIEPILNALMDGRKVHASNNMAVGCFCDWKPPDITEP